MNIWIKSIGSYVLTVLSTMMIMISGAEPFVKGIFLIWLGGIIVHNQVESVKNISR